MAGAVIPAHYCSTMMAGNIALMVMGFGLTAA
jgi:hypothetical protein